MAHDENGFGDAKAGPAEQAKLAERKFMHDLATPIAVASGQLEVMLDIELASEPLTPNQRARIEKAKKAIDRIRDMLIARRHVLVADKAAEDLALAQRKAG